MQEFYIVLPAAFLDDPNTIIRLHVVDIPLNVVVLNDALKVLEVPNHEFKVHLQEMDLECFRDILIEPSKKD